MLHHNAAATAAMLPYVPLCDAIAETLAGKRLGRVQAPQRTSLPLPGGGVLLLMPATDGDIAITKLITVHPGNPAAGLPLIQGEVDVMRAATGERLGLMDGPETTARRTAAASALAASLLAPDPEGPLLVVGAGVQALSHALAFHAVLGTPRVTVCSRRVERAKALAELLDAQGINAGYAQDPAPQAAQASLIVTATTSASPVIPEAVRDDAFIAAVGSFSPDRAEIPAGLVRRSSVYVDDLDAAREEAGDLLLAGVDWAGVTPLEDALGEGGAAPDGVAPGGPVLYKGVGHASLDLAAARLAFAQELARSAV
uniref:Delta(1)-pyrroline-2-carboxylate reductase family protein n=1 Tax=Fundidesulfovibrio putealis TaxID=270496 RepID=A0A7C4EIQ3_9BACT